MSDALPIPKAIRHSIGRVGAAPSFASFSLQHQRQIKEHLTEQSLRLMFPKYS
jgi:hypothetical protein